MLHIATVNHPIFDPQSKDGRSNTSKHDKYDIAEALDLDEFECLDEEAGADCEAYGYIQEGPCVRTRNLQNIVLEGNEWNLQWLLLFQHRQLTLEHIDVRLNVLFVLGEQGLLHTCHSTYGLVTSSTTTALVQGELLHDGFLVLDFLFEEVNIVLLLLLNSRTLRSNPVKNDK